MVIGDQHLDAARTRRRDTGIAGDAVVDGDDERRAPLGGEPDDLGREPVAELEAVGHQEIHRRESPGAQAAHDQRRAGGAIRVEVSDHEDARARDARGSSATAASTLSSVPTGMSRSSVSASSWPSHTPRAA